MADILVAEDYPATRSALRTLLKSAGHTVRFAAHQGCVLRQGSSLSSNLPALVDDAHVGHRQQRRE